MSPGLIFRWNEPTNIPFPSNVLKEYSKWAIVTETYYLRKTLYVPDYYFEITRDYSLTLGKLKISLHFTF